MARTLFVCIFLHFALKAFAVIPQEPQYTKRPFCRPAPLSAQMHVCGILAPLTFQLIYSITLFLICQSIIRCRRHFFIFYVSAAERSVAKPLRSAAEFIVCAFILSTVLQRFALISSPPRLNLSRFRLQVYRRADYSNTALILLTPDDELSSLTILNFPSSEVLLTCGPPQICLSTPSMV